VNSLSSGTPAKKSKMALESFSIRLKSMLDRKAILCFFYSNLDLTLLKSKLGDHFKAILK